MDNFNKSDLDINRLFQFIWHKKFIILTFSIIAAVILLVYSLNLPPRFKSEILLKPANVPGLQKSPSALGGLASFASSSLGMEAEVDKNVEAIKIMQSRKFVEILSERELFLPYLYAGNAWDSSKNKVIYNNDIYDEINGKWLIDLESPPHKNNIYKNWRRDFSIKLDKDGFIFASFAHSSPYVSKEILEWAVNDINFQMKVSAAKDAEKSLTFLEKNVLTISSNEIKEIFYSLIEEQLRTIMLTNSSSEYVFKIIDPAYLPQQKYKPLISLIIIIGTFLSAFLCILVLLILDRNDGQKSFLRKKD